MQIPLFPNSILNRLAEESAHFKSATLAWNTVQGYRYDWAHFCAWCGQNSQQSLPAAPQTVVFYLTYLLDQNRKIATARRRTCAIAHTHRQNGFPSPVTPEVFELLRGAQRLRQEKPRQMRPLTISELRAISGVLRERGDREALRARAILVFGFASALRRVNLATLMLSEIEFTQEGLTIAVSHEKQDQEGKGRVIGLPAGKHPDTCPIRCLRDWLDQRGSEPGPVFSRLRVDAALRDRPIDGDRIAHIIREAVSLAGGNTERVGGHSLRAGFVTAALEAGVNEIVVANHTGHKSLATLKRYYRPSDPFRVNACAALDL